MNVKHHYNWLIFLVFILIFVSCNNNGYKITGQFLIDQIPDTLRIYRVSGEEEYIELPVINGEFSHTGVVDSIELYTFLYGNHSMYPFFIEPGNIHITIKNEGETTIEGTPNNIYLSSFYNAILPLEKDIETLISQEQKLHRNGTMTKEIDDSMRQQYNRLIENFNSAIFDTIVNNRDELANIYTLALTYRMHPEKIIELIDTLEKSIQSHPEVISLRQSQEAQLKSRVGESYSDFRLIDLNGNFVNLSDYVSNNQYTLLVFWTSWCAPCIDEIPYLKSAYKNFKAKGFEIVGVSLDNSRDAWKNVIKKHDIKWPQLSDIKGFDTQAAKLYGVQGVPAIFLINKEGSIVANNPRGEELEVLLNQLMP